MKDDACSYSHVQTGSLFGILRNIYKKIAQFLVDWQHTSPLIAQKESSASSKWLCLYGQTAFPNLYSAYPDAVLIECLLALLQRVEWFVLYLLVGALIAKHLEFFKNLHLLGLRAIGDEEDLLETECTCTSDDIADVVLLAYVVQQKISLRVSLLVIRDIPFVAILHQQLYNQSIIDIWKVQLRHLQHKAKVVKDLAKSFIFCLKIINLKKNAFIFNPFYNQPSVGILFYPTIQIILPHRSLPLVCFLSPAHHFITLEVILLA